jgi:uncharacterized protein (DUF433 family)
MAQEAQHWVGKRWRDSDCCAVPQSRLDSEHKKDAIMTVPPLSILRDPEILSGTACFAGTRVPVSALMDYLKAGDRIDDFLDDFPTVDRDQIACVLQIASEAVTDYARSA